jgi:hypothetical protein
MGLSKNKRWMAMGALAGCVMTGEVWAHSPTFDEGAYSSAEDPFLVDDPSVSIVLYRNVTCDQPELWMELRATAGFPLFVQLLIPQIDRLTDYRPSIAVVGPGLPPADLGIEIPDGMGAVVFDTTDVATPEPFYEPFTQTNDLILVEETVTLPIDATYYVVAWDPERQTGKLAVAVGTVEQFGLDALAALPEWTRKTRAFHETPDYPPAEPIEEQVCPSAAGEPGAPVVEESTTDAGLASDDSAPATGASPPATDGSALATGSSPPATDGSAPATGAGAVDGDASSGDSSGCSLGRAPRGRSGSALTALLLGCLLVARRGSGAVRAEDGA